MLPTASSPQPATHQGPSPTLNVSKAGAPNVQRASQPSHNNPKVVISQQERALAERAGKKRKEPIVPALVSATQNKGDEGVSAAKRSRVEVPPVEAPKPMEADEPMPEPEEPMPGILIETNFRDLP